VKRGGILLIIVLVLAGGVGWYVWDQNKKDNMMSISSTTPLQQGAATYLRIPEKGVKFKLTPKINDAYYFTNTSGNTYISLHRFDNIKDAKGCTAQGNEGEGGGVELLKTAKPGEDNAGSPWTRQQLEDKKTSNNASLINGVYYWLEPIHASCTNSNNPEANTIENEIADLRSEFVKIKNTISPI
jgi:hypothetical protein